MAEEQQAEEVPPLVGWLWLPIAERKHVLDLVWECVTCGLRNEVPVEHSCEGWKCLCST